MGKKSFFWLVTLLLVGCTTDPNTSAMAGEIIKKDLRSPSSFSLVSGKEMWKGKDQEGNPAFIVRVEYDAQNGFGAMIRDCKLVAS